MSGEAVCGDLHRVIRAGRELAKRGVTPVKWSEHCTDRAIVLSTFALEVGSEEARRVADMAWRAVADARTRRSTRRCPGGIVSARDAGREPESTVLASPVIAARRDLADLGKSIVGDRGWCQPRDGIGHGADGEHAGERADGDTGEGRFGRHLIWK